uniref:Uncharacterized protein n=1 Tax=Arundo donax TaxID=35708 RepID=A0A0A8YQ21_ARUDO
MCWLFCRMVTYTVSCQSRSRYINDLMCYWSAFSFPL